MKCERVFELSSKLLGSMRVGPSRRRRRMKLAKKLKPIVYSWNTPEERRKFNKVRADIRRLEKKLFPVDPDAS